jgi:hypothetical protein
MIQDTSAMNGRFSQKAPARQKEALDGSVIYENP